MLEQHYLYQISFYFGISIQVNSFCQRKKNKKALKLSRIDCTNIYLVKENMSDVQIFGVGLQPHNDNQSYLIYDTIRN